MNTASKFGSDIIYVNMNNSLTALAGVQVGHSTHLDKLTGCTFVLFDKPYPVAYKSYGGAAGSFNTEMLNNGMSFYKRQGLFIAGGSLTGLMSASEIMQRMIDNKVIPQHFKIVNPSISGAIVFDLGTRIEQYDPKYGREAYENLSRKPVESGNVGAGTGVSVGKFQYLESGKKIGAMKAGVGNARVDFGHGGIITAMSVVNAVGNVINPDGTILAGNRDSSKKFKEFDDLVDFVTRDETNTTITIVGTNIKLKSREDYEKIAHFASQGQTRAINPVNTSIDGDTVFVFSTEEVDSPFNFKKDWFETPDWPLFTVDVIGHFASKAVQESIYDACKSSNSIKFKDAYKEVIPSCNDY